MVATIVLVGGTSHAGKSSLAKRLSQRRGTRVLSTDTLARHPGRPWGLVRDHVREHYTTLTVEELIADVVRHYESVWPQVLEAISQHVAQPEGGLLVVEGSAVLPHLARGVAQAAETMVWLTAARPDLESRIHGESSYGQLQMEARLLVDRFLARTIAFDEYIRGECARYGLRLLESGSSHGPLESLSVHGRIPGR